MQRDGIVGENTAKIKPLGIMHPWLLDHAIRAPEPFPQSWFLNSQGRTFKGF